MMTDDKCLNEIVQGVKRHHGALKAIAEEAGVHRTYVWKVLKGKRKSMRVLEVAAAHLVVRDTELIERQARVRAMLSSSGKKLEQQSPVRL